MVPRRPRSALTWPAERRLLEAAQRTLQVLEAARLPHEMKTADANFSNTPKLTNEQYFEERRLLLAGRQRGYQRADQMIVGGATGALVLSITFLRNLGSAAGLLASWWLVSAWILLLVTLLLNLWSNYTSARSFEVEIKRLEAWLHDEEKPANQWAARTLCLGRISGLLFVGGITALAFFRVG